MVLLYYEVLVTTKNKILSKNQSAFTKGQQKQGILQLERYTSLFVVKIDDDRDKCYIKNYLICFGFC